jgi:hypothetical protein
MATPNDIPSDLTLEISDNLPPDEFLSAVRNFLGYVEKMGKFIAPFGGADDWLVRVKEGSNLIGLDPGKKAKLVPVRSLYRAIETGIKAIESGNLDAAQVPYAALNHLKLLSQVGKKGKIRTTQLRVWIEKRPTFIGDGIAIAIEEDWRSDYKDHGSIEGKLGTIQDRRGLQIKVDDPVLKQAVQCIVPEDMLPEVFSNFRKRVEVYGLIHFRKNGYPISIDVESIIPLPDDDDLPSLDDVRGILSDQAWQN